MLSRLLVDEAGKLIVVDFVSFGFCTFGVVIGDLDDVCLETRNLWLLRRYFELSDDYR